MPLFFTCCVRFLFVLLLQLIICVREIYSDTHAHSSSCRAMLWNSIAHSSNCCGQCCFDIPNLANYPKDVLDSCGFSKQHCPQQLPLRAMKFHSIAQQLLLWASVPETIFRKNRIDIWRNLNPGCFVKPKLIGW